MMENKERKLSPAIVGISSAIVWGLGQFINKQYVKSLFFIAFQIALISIEVVTGNYGNISGGFSFRNNGGFFVRGFWGLITLGEQTQQLTMAGLTDGDHSILLLISGLISLISFAIFAVIWSWNIRDAISVRKQINNGERVLTIKQYIAEFWHKMFSYIVLTPATIALLFISVMPIFFGLLIAFTNYSRNNLPPANLIEWVGFENFFNILSMPMWTNTFIGVFGWTIVWAVLSTVTCFFGGLFMAVLVNSDRVKFKKLWRTIFILPWAIPGMISLLVFRTIFNGQFGPVSQFIYDMGWSDGRILWLTDSNNPNLARITILLINLWLGFPYFMALMSGVMTGISKEVYEAARIDGANPSQEFWKITLPLVLSATAPLLIMSFAGNFNNFNVIYFLTGGGPANPAYQFAGHTDILITWIYSLTLNNRMYNMASVMSIIIFLVIGSISTWNFMRTKAFREDA